VICAEAVDAHEAVRAALDERPDVCLLDIRMRGGGIVAAAEIRSRVPETAVVMLTVSSDDSDLLDSIRAGAVGYLLKDTDPARLPEALRGVLAGEAALPRRLVARLIEAVRERESRRARLLADGRRVDLTSREWDVLDLLVEGLSTTEIGRRLFVSPVTVRSHVAAIVRKLDARDRSEAVRLVAGR
jgi:DNA-binding NarL/FixJ family response regulator